MWRRPVHPNSPAERQTIRYLNHRKGFQDFNIPLRGVSHSEKICRKSQQHEDSAIIGAGSLFNHIHIDPCVPIYKQGCVLQRPRDLIRVLRCCTCWESVRKGQQTLHCEPYDQQSSLYSVHRCVVHGWMGHHQLQQFLRLFQHLFRCRMGENSFEIFSGFLFLPLVFH